MWCKVLDKVAAPAGFIYCTTGIGAGELEKLPLTSGYAYTGEHRLAAMVQQAVQRLLSTWQERLVQAPCVGVIVDGADAIACLEQSVAHV